MDLDRAEVGQPIYLHTNRSRQLVSSRELQITGMQRHHNPNTFSPPTFNTLPFYGSGTLVGLVLLSVEVPRSHSDMPHSVGLLWTSDQTVLTHNTHKEHTSMPPVEFGPAIPTSEQQQKTYTLDLAAIGIGHAIHYYKITNY
jgi:hypothetical protein